MTSSEVRSLLHPQTTFTYNGRDEFQKAAERSLDSQGEEIRALLQKIARCGLEVTSEVRLQIVPEVIDERGNRGDPLPEIQPRDVQLTR